MKAKGRSTLSACVRDYLAQRRSLGFELEMGDLVLGDFVKYAKVAGHHGPLTTALMLRWATERPEHSSHYRAERLSIVRGFAAYLAARDGKTEVPQQRLLASRFRRGQPHLYSNQQLRQLLDSAAVLRSPYPLRPATYAALFGLLASTGMRVSEGLGLKFSDVDLRQSILHVRQTKFRKSRLVPIHPSVTKALSRYAEQRKKDPAARWSAWFFVGRGGQPLPYSSVRQAFRRISSRLGWRSNGHLALPRIHDLRHAFAVRRLLAWYRNGVDVEQAIASLSTYLGHGKVTDTYWYLTGTRELLAVAGNRFEQFALSSRLL
jgi:integrase